MTTHYHLPNPIEVYAWPGGYPVSYLADDGGCLCPACVSANLEQVTESTETQAGDGWQIVGCDANWEDPNLYCDHCGNRIESAYAEDDAK